MLHCYYALCTQFCTCQHESLPADMAPPSVLGRAALPEIFRPQQFGFFVKQSEVTFLLPASLICQKELSSALRVNECSEQSVTICQERLKFTKCAGTYVYWQYSAGSQQSAQRNHEVADSRLTCFSLLLLQTT